MLHFQIIYSITLSLILYALLFSEMMIENLQAVYLDKLAVAIMEIIINVPSPSVWALYQGKIRLSKTVLCHIPYDEKYT
jgi:hypothetical protein